MPPIDDAVHMAGQAPQYSALDGNINGQDPDEGILDQQPPRAPGASDHLDQRISLQGARVTQEVSLPPGRAEALRNISVPRAREGVLNSLVRHIMSFFNALGLSGRSRESSTVNTPELLDSLARMQPPPTMGNAANEGHPYRMGAQMLGKLAGLGETAQAVPFEMPGNAQGFRESVFGPHGPRLDDIKQDPNLQDSWFLSSITSAMVASGTETITRLFSEGQHPGTVMVRLGENEYEVPFGRLTNDRGQVYGSKSAKWVVALENAMLMHMAATSTASAEELRSRPGQISMSGADPLLGLRAIYGVANDDARANTILVGNSANEVFDAVRQQKWMNQPVILQHRSQGTAMSTNIAAHQAVTVLDVVNNNVRILDPYGKVVDIPKSSLKNFTVQTMEIYRPPIVPMAERNDW